MRRKIAAGAALALAGLITAAPHFSSAQSTTPPWPQFHADQLRDGAINATGTHASSALQAFSIAAGPGLSTLASSPVLDATGVAYIGSDAGYLYALNSANATIKWKTAKLGGPVVSTPALSSDGSKVYFASEEGTVYALATSDGHKLWSVNLGSTVIASPLLSNDGTFLYVNTLNGTLYALDTTNSGATKWKFSPGGAMPTSPSSSSGGSNVDIVAGSELFFIPATAGPNGSGTPPVFLDGAGNTTPAVDQNGNVYVGTVNGYMDCFNQTGQMCWSQQHQVPGFPSITSTPAFVGGNAVFGAGNTVYAIAQASGTQVWQFATKGGVNSSPAVASTNSTIYVGSDDLSIYAIDNMGHQIFSRALGGQIDSSPAIAADGTVWVADRGGNVFRFGTIAPPATLAIPSGTPTLAATATATTPPATSTPTVTPTATLSPLVPLDFTLKGSLTDGQNQLIKFTSAPNTVIHIRVQYPNGDHQSHQVTTNGSGAATYKYKQGGSKTTHKLFTATVTAKAGTGATLNTVSKSYTIKFGKIDLSIEPRKQSVGKVIDIFVHAAKGSNVVVYLLPPSGHLITRTGRTGPKGLSSIKIKLTSGLVKGNNRKVPVLAKLRNNPNIATKSYFTIQ